MRRAALFISPHLDDVAFSCGGTLARLAAEGYETHLCTIFTASVPNPRGFALQCQTDKGLPADVDYMRLRRAEDEEFARRAGASRVHHLGFAEAPHRGYESAAELFGGVRASDEVWREVAPRLRRVYEEVGPQLSFAPQGLGAHVDHEQTIRAVLALGPMMNTLWYKDTPYAMRDAGAEPSRLLPGGMPEAACDIGRTLRIKLAAIEAYSTQLGFQFGGGRRMRETLAGFHKAEAELFAAAGEGAAERFRHAETFDVNLLRPLFIKPLTPARQAPSLNARSA